MNGWVLLAPAGLFALAALAVPLLIHLLSRSRGQRVLVGNIELFRQLRRQRASQIRLVQWLLLALRLLMLLLGALLLAELARQGMARPVENTAFITPARLAAADRGEAPVPADHQQLVSLTGGWPQLAEALARQPPVDAVPVYTLASAGDQPAGPLALSAPVTWLSEGAAAPRGPSSLDVLIAHDPERLNDARALEAALRAVADFRTLVVAVQLVDSSSALPLAAGKDRRALIWLSNKPVPPGNGASDLLIESADSPTGPQTFVSVSDWPGMNFLGAGSAEAPGQRGEALWRDAAGRPLLVEKRMDGQRRLELAQPLSLEVNGPVAQDGWPDTLARLLLDEARWQSGTAHAALPAGQPPPATPLLGRGQPARPLSSLLAIVLALLFVAERWLAERPRNDASTHEQGNG